MLMAAPYRPGSGRMRRRKPQASAGSRVDQPAALLRCFFLPLTGPVRGLFFAHACDFVGRPRFRRIRAAHSGRRSIAGRAQPRSERATCALSRTCCANVTSESKTSPTREWMAARRRWVFFRLPAQFRALTKTPCFAMTCLDSTKQLRESRPAPRAAGRRAARRASGGRLAIRPYGAEDSARRFKHLDNPGMAAANAARARATAASQKVLAALRAAV
jgi:hypothetical protein